MTHQTETVTLTIIITDTPPKTTNHRYDKTTYRNMPLSEHLTILAKVLSQHTNTYTRRQI